MRPLRTRDRSIGGEISIEALPGAPIIGRLPSIGRHHPSSGRPMNVPDRWELSGRTRHEGSRRISGGGGGKLHGGVQNHLISRRELEPLAARALKVDLLRRPEAIPCHRAPDEELDDGCPWGPSGSLELCEESLWQDGRAGLRVKSERKLAKGVPVSVGTPMGNKWPAPVGRPRGSHGEGGGRGKPLEQWPWAEFESSGARSGEHPADFVAA